MLVRSCMGYSVSLVHLSVCPSTNLSAFYLIISQSDHQQVQSLVYLRQCQHHHPIHLHSLLINSQSIISQSISVKASVEERYAQKTYDPFITPVYHLSWITQSASHTNLRSFCSPHVSPLVCESIFHFACQSFHLKNERAILRCSIRG